MIMLNQCLQLIFSVFVLCSAFLCFTLEKDWFKGIPAQTKIPSYALIGVSVAFSFIYTIVDFIQMLMDYLYSLYYKHFAPMTKTKQPL